ncbi:GNAT family N-acetyltransferase [Micrococcales bacterium 31B]|nr:GNAT family N-acetyltransferase [Micrococcales bacterium 31B]
MTVPPVPPAVAATAVRGPDLDAATLHDLLRLRAEVFVVEQDCPYLDIDGHDLAPGTVHWYARDAEGLVGCLRVLSDSPAGYARIGRVCTASRARGTGVGGLLMDAAVAGLAGQPQYLEAQTYARGFYERYGFVARGDYFYEDNIEHVRMYNEA